MRAGLKSALVLLLLAVARPAAAERLDVAALPSAELLPIPATRPSGIQRSERTNIEGLWVAVSPHRSSEQWGSLGILDNAEAAKFYARGGYSYSTEQASTSCFRVEDEQAASPRQWPLSGMLFAQVDVRLTDDKSTEKPDVSSPVRAIRFERLTLTGNRRARLDATDLWIDSRTRGMRLIQRREVDLARVAGIDPAVMVFVARGTDAVHFVIVPSDETWKTISRERFGPNQITLERGTEQGFTPCGHVTLSLRAPIGAGETATVRLKTPTRWQPHPAPPGRAISAVVARVLAPGQAPRAGAAFSGEVTVRGLAVHVSASRPRRERPLSASVAFNWTQEAEKLEL